MSVYKIFPDTSASGLVINEDTANADDYLCRRFCDDIEDCSGFSISDNTNCKLYSNVSNITLSPRKDVDFYMKNGNTNYWPLWILITGVLLILFFNKCK